MSDGMKILAVLVAFVSLMFLFGGLQKECEATGGRLMKTLGNQFECVK
jgi:hypothetical protein